MKMYILFIVCCLVSLFAAAAIHAQGFMGPGSFPPPPPGPGLNHPPHGPGHAPPPPTPPIERSQGWYGFTGPVQTVTVEQIKTFAHRTPVLITGAIAQFIWADCYTFRDSSGEITIRIGPREWEALGSTISVSDNIEISGEVHRDELDLMRMPEVHVRFIRKL